MKFCITLVLLLAWSIQMIEGQTNRTTSGCSVALCPSSTRTTNASCSTGNTVCYSYQVQLTNQTFCAPSLTCSLFEPCGDGVACGSNTSVCLSSTCCPRPICMPVAIGVSMCNSTIPTILPNECYSHTVNTDFTRNVNYNGSTSLCDQTDFPTGRWIRFGGEAGTRLSTSVTSNGRCGTYYTSYLNDTHPARLGEKKTATVCYVYYESCYWQNSIQITNCGDFFVYYLSPPPTCNLRYCTV